MAEVPEGAELVPDGSLMFPAVAVRNVYILPGVPEIFRQKFEALKERFRETPFHLASVFVGIGEGTLADHLNALARAPSGPLLGSYPEFSNPEYKVKVTLESKDRRPGGPGRRRAPRRPSRGGSHQGAALARVEPDHPGPSTG